MGRGGDGLLVLRRRVCQVLDMGLAGDRFGQQVHWFLIALVLLNVCAVVLESVPAFESRFRVVFWIVEALAMVFFTIEYIARLWTAVDHGHLEGRSPLKARLAHAVSTGMIIDLLAILPFYLSMFVNADLRILLVLRLFRFFKIARYSTGMRSLGDALYSERQALAACGGILTGLVLLSASFMHLAESDAQPEKFSTIPDAMYWSIITLTTVGYGDVFPITTEGKLIASVTAVLGLGMLALPVGILATAFADVVHRREFVVTWGMVARVPLFKGMDAETIAELMRFLRSQTAPAGRVIVRKGDEADSMFFIAAGEVEVDVPGKPVVLSQGDFFGEIALVADVTRTATVRACTRASLLVLGAADVRGLMERRPDVAARLQSIASDKAGQAAGIADGDLAVDELRHHETIKTP